MGGTIISYEESGIWTRRRPRHNGYSSGFSPSRDEWSEQGWTTATTHPSRGDRREDLR